MRKRKNSINSISFLSGRSIFAKATGLSLHLENIWRITFWLRLNAASAASGCDVFSARILALYNVMGNDCFAVDVIATKRSGGHISCCCGVSCGQTFEWECGGFTPWFYKTIDIQPSLSKKKCFNYRICLGPRNKPDHQNGSQSVPYGFAQNVLKKCSQTYFDLSSGQWMQ